ncbi:MAG: hypothetical protein HY359_11935 [Candidatus Rokubacteria bacterium]|nr:hypothetical protein [Candidatus Rokubacteria bacterium]
MLDPDEETAAEEIGSLLARAHVMLGRGGQQPADEALRAAARRLQAARPGLPDYDARKAVVHALRTAYPEHAAFTLPPEPTFAPPDGEPLRAEALPRPEGWESRAASRFTAAAGWPDAEAEAFFRRAFEAGWSRAGAHLPDADWARRLYREFADSPYGAPARPAWLT